MTVGHEEMCQMHVFLFDPGKNVFGWRVWPVFMSISATLVQRTLPEMPNVIQY